MSEMREDFSEYFSERDMFLMREAMSASSCYESLEGWLSEIIADGGYIVAQHLSHDANKKQAAHSVNANKMVDHAHGAGEMVCGQGDAEPVADFQAEIRMERDYSEEYNSYLAFISGGKLHPYMYIPESLDQEVLDEALRRLNTHPVPEGWKDCLEEMVEAMRLYQMDCDEDPPHKHKAMMARARALLDSATQPPKQEGE